MRDDQEAAGIEVRRATAADAPAIGAVFDAAVRVGWPYLGELSQRSMFPPEEWDREVADHAPPNAMLVAADNAGRILGFTAVHPAEGEMYLLFVDPDVGGRGIGRALLAAAHDVLRSAGCRESFLYTDVHNERAIAVYTRAGYEPDGSVRESDFRGIHIRELRLVKRLSQTTTD